METKHTPGPWTATFSTVDKGEGWTTPFASIEHGSPREGSIAYVSLNPGQVHANARLIAAAPELLAVALAELNAVEQDIRWAEASQLEALIERRERLEAAIAKATGAAA